MTIAPDASVAGLLGQDADPLRYGDSSFDDPSESPGILRAFMPNDARVLDVGCGGGGQTIEMNRGKNNDVICIEPDPHRASAARMKGLKVHQGMLDEEFARANGKFDVIVLADVLEHLVDPMSLLKSAIHCLAPNGRIFLSVPNVAHWTVRVKLLLGRFNYSDTGIMDATHLRWFTKKTLTDLLHNAGLEIVDFKYAGGLWIWEYNGALMRGVPFRLKRAVVLGLLSIFPTLMGVQHVVNAKLTANKVAA